MDVGSAAASRAALREGHGGEVAVVGGADPARARRIGAELARPAASRPAARSRPTPGRARSFRPSAEKHSRSNAGIVVGARAEPALANAGLMRVDEGHALGRRVAADGAALAARQRLEPRQERRSARNPSTCRSRAASAVNAGCTSRPSRPPGQGAVACSAGWP